jgi:hypothetical protein
MRNLCNPHKIAYFFYFFKPKILLFGNFHHFKGKGDR